MQVNYRTLKTSQPDREGNRVIMVEKRDGNVPIEFITWKEDADGNRFYGRYYPVSQYADAFETAAKDFTARAHTLWITD